MCVTTYQQLKLGKKFKYILFTLNDALSEIVVDKTSDASSYEVFVADMPKDQCRWAVYDFEFEKEGKRNKLCFILWCVPSTCFQLGGGGWVCQRGGEESTYEGRPQPTYIDHFISQVSRRRQDQRQDGVCFLLRDPQAEARWYSL